MALSLNSGLVQDVNKVSLLIGPGKDFSVIIPHHPLLRSAEPHPGCLVGSLLKVHHVGLQVHGIPLFEGRVEEIGRIIDLPPQHKLEFRLTADRKAPAICVRCSSQQFCALSTEHSTASMRVRLYLSTWPLADGG